jgi:dGTPase
LEGIVKHNGPIVPSASLPTIRAFNAIWDLELTSFAGAEAQVAALADDIAYNTHDADDGHHAGFFRLEDLSELPLFGPSARKMEKLYPNVDRARLMYESVREIIGLMVDDVLATTRRNLDELKPKSVEEIRKARKATVGFSEEMSKNINVLHNFLHVRMYRHSEVNQACDKARKIVRELFDYYAKQPDRLPSSWGEEIKVCQDETARARTIADYIAGMTDRFAIREYRKIFGTEIMI